MNQPLGHGTQPAGGTAEAWPALSVASWVDTRDAVHLWTQMVGKTRLALAPMENHWWNVPLYVNSVGLTTSLMPRARHAGLEIVFDFAQHQLVLALTDGQQRRLQLASRSVADFYAEYLRKLAELEVDVVLNPMPCEIPGAVPFPADTASRPYDAAAMNAFWRSLVTAHRILNQFRGEYDGKCSPVHFFWGAFDLAVSRFSGRPAPVHPGGVPHCPDSVMVEAYRSELASYGYWPGGGVEGAFYAYAYPEPPGYREHSLRQGVGYFDHDLGEFILPYAEVRCAIDPDAVVLDFLRDVDRFASAAWPLG